MAVDYNSDPLSTSKLVPLSTPVSLLVTALTAALNLLPRYAIEPCPLDRSDVEVFREDSARETSASSGCKSATANAGTGARGDRRPARHRGNWRNPE
jgi:hypothetical protein